MARKKSTFIGVKFGDYAILIKNAREVYGHDDSFPFNAEFELLDNDNKCVLNGTAWNDGWGGDTQLDFQYNEENREIFAKANAACLKAFTHETTTSRGSTFTMDIDLAFLVESMASLSVYNPQNNGHIFAEKVILDFFKSH